MSEKRLREIEKLRQRVTDLKNGGLLEHDEWWGLLRALDGEEEFLKYLSMHVRALRAFENAGVDDKFKAFAREFGFEPSTDLVRRVGGGGTKYDRAAVVDFYVRAVRSTEVLDRRMARTFPAAAVALDGPPSLVPLPERHRTALEAVRLTAEVFGFPNVSACLRYLERRKQELREGKAWWAWDGLDPATLRLPSVIPEEAPAQRD